MTWFEIAIEFPNLQLENFNVESSPNPLYNCIAYAASDTTRLWWPSPKKAYWPPGAPRELTVNAFKAAFASLGFVECEDGTLEHGVEKIAIYASHTKVPRHAALQLPNGRWASKLGREDDIEHDSEKGVSGDNYGAVVAYMKRPAQEGGLGPDRTFLLRG